MKTTITVFSRMMFLTGLLALAGCGQGQDDGSDTASAPATEAGEQTATTEQPAASSQTESATEETDTAADEAGTSEAAAADSGADTGDTGGGESYTVTARATSYDPVVLQINPGDNVNWTNMSGHNVHFEEGNIPADAETWQTPLGENVNKTFTKEGIYLYKCDPHFAMGMVGAIIVGKPTNLAEVEQNAKGMYKRALAKATAQLK